MDDNTAGLLVILALLSLVLVPLVGIGIGAAVKWLLEFRAERVEARREHELALERERTKQIEAQRARDEALWLRAVEDRDAP